MNNQEYKKWLVSEIMEYKALYDDESRAELMKKSIRTLEIMHDYA